MKRKAVASLPLHKRRKLLSVNLSKELREKYKKRSIVVRTGDTVKVLVGNHKGKEAKVIDVDYKKLKVYLEDIKRSNAKGDDVYIPFDPSNLQIVELDKSDSKRFKKLFAKDIKE
jgi:large subunit ribosomal protein L24